MTNNKLIEEIKSSSALKTYLWFVKFYHTKFFEPFVIVFVVGLIFAITTVTFSHVSGRLDRLCYNYNLIVALVAIPFGFAFAISHMLYVKKINELVVKYSMDELAVKGGGDGGAGLGGRFFALLSLFEFLHFLNFIIHIFPKHFKD